MLSGPSPYQNFLIQCFIFEKSRSGNIKCTETENSNVIFSSIDDYELMRERERERAVMNGVHLPTSGAIKC